MDIGYSELNKQQIDTKPLVHKSTGGFIVVYRFRIQKSAIQDKNLLFRTQIVDFL